MKNIIYVVLIISMTNGNALANNANCITQAESEYGVLPGLISVMKSSESSDENLKGHLYGPMGLNKKVIEVAARGMNVSQTSIQEESCMNYRAAAWLLMNVYGGYNEKDIFNAVNRYYYGQHIRTVGKQTQLVKKRYMAQTR
jgi:hypothetical protein